MRQLSILLAALLLLAATTALADIAGRVVVVTDGDTLKILDSDQVQHKVCLMGIDAPERGQPFDTVSRDHLASLVAGKEVRVESTLQAPPPEIG
jgi:endonuclease YncB( thermonuclease family)